MYMRPNGNENILFKRYISHTLIYIVLVVCSMQQQRVVVSSSAMFITRKWPSSGRSAIPVVSNYMYTYGNYPIGRRISQWFSSSLSSSSLEILEEEIFVLANHEKFNINSSRQVASLVFEDSTHSASRKVLSNFVQKYENDFTFWIDENLHDKRRRVQLAEKVLEWRDVQSKIRKSSSVIGQSSSRDDFVVQKRSLSSGSKVIDGDELSSKAETEPSSMNVNLVTANDTSYSKEKKLVHQLFYESSKIDTFWKEHLEILEKPSSKALLGQLHSDCPIGFNPLAVAYSSFSSIVGKKLNSNSNIGKKGSLLGYVREQKIRFPDKVILTKVGEFYEAFGIDAILLVEHCGLNSMAEKARAGCPLKNIQATLDSLTSKGFSVAIYEEAADTDSSTGPGASSGSKSRLKSRFLGQIVSPANPTYMHGLVMSNLGLATTPSRPYIGIISLSSGYTLVEISIEERTVRILERLTSEAVACHLQAFPPAEPLFYMPPAAEAINGERNIIPFLSSRSDFSNDGPGARIRTKFIHPILNSNVSFKKDVKHASTIVLNELLQLCNEGDDSTSLISDEFIFLGEGGHSGTAPLFLETAAQLGLMLDPHIPSLVHSLLPDFAPAACRRFLRRWLLTPPPPNVANAMTGLVSFMKNEGVSLPHLIIPPIGKTLSVIRARQASAQVFREICTALYATISTIDQFKQVECQNELISTQLATLLEFESGLPTNIDDLRYRCEICVSLINDVILTESSLGDEVTDFDQTIPKGFFERNELHWRGRVRRGIVFDSYDAVDKAALHLVKQVERDFWGPYNPEEKDSKNIIVQDIFNNIFAIKSIPIWIDEPDKKQYYQPRDRRGQLLKNRFTTQAVEQALVDYVDSCERASLATAEALSSLSDCLSDNGHLPAVVQSAHANVILSVTINHASSANMRGWNVAECSKELDNKFSCLWPYWMDRTQGVSNSFTLDGIFLLTAPNMSGKSTLMRSTAAVALLTTCGLCAPVEKGTSMKRFDRIFVRGASADVPSEGKSAFGAEMGDIASLLRQCGTNSLIFVDEIGRGTSPKDGTCLAGAVLEEIADLGMTGIFATHLHDILKLPLKEEVLFRLHTKRMAVETPSESSSGVFKWTYKLEDGVCTNSLALLTASQFGVPSNVLNRAAEMSKCYEENSEEIAITSSGNNLSLTLDVASDILRDATGVDRVATIPSGWSCPPSFEGCSCVYVLEVNEKYYVGETDNISKRMSQHRAKGNDWSDLRAAVAAISGGKTIARNLESIVIQELSRQGFKLISVHDGRSISPLGQRNNQDA